MSRKTRTAWLVVDRDGNARGQVHWKRHGAIVERDWRDACRYDGPHRVTRVQYPWPPAKKRRMK